MRVSQKGFTQYFCVGTVPDVPNSQYWRFANQPLSKYNSRINFAWAPDDIMTSRGVYQDEASNKMLIPRAQGWGEDTPQFDTDPYYNHQITNAVSTDTFGTVLNGTTFKLLGLCTDITHAPIKINFGNYTEKYISEFATTRKFPLAYNNSILKDRPFALNAAVSVQEYLLQPICVLVDEYVNFYLKDQTPKMNIDIQGDISVLDISNPLILKFKATSTKGGTLIFK